MFQGTKITIAKKIGHDQAEKFFNQSIYLMSIGSNDYINNYLLPVLADSWTYTPDGFIEYLASTLRQQITVSFSRALNLRPIIINAPVVINLDIDI